MTREEAIKLLEHISIAYTPTDAYGDYDDPRPYEEAIDMAIEALSADTVSREAYHNLVTASNDIDRALREYQDKEENGELLSVVRCKDCKHYKIVTDGYGVCLERQIVMTTQRDDDFCSYGERREP